MSVPATIAIDPKQPIAAQVYEQLSRMIIRAELEPGASLSEKELALRLGVSRTPVREALIRLSSDGLVHIFPQRGTTVAPIERKQVFEAQFIREALELAVVRRASAELTSSDIRRLEIVLLDQERAAEGEDYAAFLELDETFHRSLSEAVGFARAWRIIQSVKIHMDRVRFLSLPKPHVLAELIAQHRAVLAALADRDAQAAESAMQDHLRRVFTALEELMTSHGAYFGPAEAKSGERS